MLELLCVYVEQKLVCLCVDSFIKIVQKINTIKNLWLSNNPILGLYEYFTNHSPQISIVIYRSNKVIYTHYSHGLLLKLLNKLNTNINEVWV